MSNSLISVFVRHERRLRLTFSNTLGSGAFGAPAPSYYTVLCLDGKASDPVVVSAMIVPGDGATVELSLGGDLANWAHYRVTAEGVPATDLSVTPAGTLEDFRYSAVSIKKTVEPALRDLERAVFQADLIWNGTDFEEDATGDLQRVEGKANVTKALWRGVETNGLPWDDTWGIDVREYVDSPSSLAAPLRGLVAKQIAKDRRVTGVQTEVEIQGDKTFIHIYPTLRGGFKAEAVSVTVPNA